MLLSQDRIILIFFCYSVCSNSNRLKYPLENRLFVKQFAEWVFPYHYKLNVFRSRINRYLSYMFS